MYNLSLLHKFCFVKLCKNFKKLRWLKKKQSYGSKIWKRNKERRKLFNWGFLQRKIRILISPSVLIKELKKVYQEKTAPVRLRSSPLLLKMNQVVNLRGLKPLTDKKDSVALRNFWIAICPHPMANNYHKEKRLKKKN